MREGWPAVEHPLPVDAPVDRVGELAQLGLVGEVAIVELPGGQEPGDEQAGVDR